MLSVVDIEFIRRKHDREGWSIRKIAKQLEISRQTVRKALQSPGPWEYTLTQPKPAPVMAPYQAVVREWLREDEGAPLKQRHTGKRIHRRLVEEYGFVGAESTVRRYVGVLRRELHQASIAPFLVLTAEPGEMAQVDWGQAEVLVQGQPTCVHLFCLRLRFSGVPYVCAFPHERLEAFLEGHVRVFHWLGGIPHKLVYDNLTPVVRKVLRPHQRQLHDRFLALRCHYLFESVFCNVACGHEKGSVENLVGYVRRNALTPVPHVEALESLNAHLLHWCEQERHRSQPAWDAEALALHPLPAQAFQPAIRWLVSVDKLSLVTVDKNRYSVPTSCLERSVAVDAYPDRLEIWYQGEVVARHPRVYGPHPPQLQLNHYLNALARKPYAVMNAAVVRQLPAPYQQVRERLCQTAATGYREFVAVLLLHREFPARWIEELLQEGLLTGELSAPGLREKLLQRTGVLGRGGSTRTAEEGEEGRENTSRLHLDGERFRVPVGEPRRYEQLTRVAQEAVVAQEPCSAGGRTHDVLSTALPREAGGDA